MFDIFYFHNPLNMFPHEQRTVSVEHAREASRTRYLWIADGLNDYSGFDWLWEPPPGQENQIHIWPSQHQANGGTYLIPRHDAADTNREHPVISRIGSAPRIHIHHGADKLQDNETRYINDYLGTLRRALSKVDFTYCWVTSDVCDYTNFDFTWHPSEWQLDMLHVFPSNEQKFGDTFYVHVPSFLEKSEKIDLLEWFDTIHFVENFPVPRHAMPVIMHREDTHIGKIQSESRHEPLMLFTVRPVDQQQIPTVNLWREKTKTVVPLDPSGSSMILPRIAIPYIKTQVYDYPHIDKTKKKTLDPVYQDIVFISYDEPQAEQNWKKLTDRFPNAKRIDRVSGMENALVAAARASSTPWYFAVFAKTELAETFDFSFCPDYLQQPKHYIFDCHNTVNNLVYGHMGVVLYNVKYVLLEKSYRDLDLDYTLSFLHEVIPELSCYGRFNSSAYHTWRTAFRECAKLALYNSREPSVETQYRLSVWTSFAQGDYAEWCLNGARDGIKFFQETAGDMTELKHSFDWRWLRVRFVGQYGEID